VVRQNHKVVPASQVDSQYRMAAACDGCAAQHKPTQTFTSGKSPGAKRQLAEASAARHELDGSVIVVFVDDFIEVSMAQFAQVQRQWPLIGDDHGPGCKSLPGVHHLAGVQAPLDQFNDQVAQGPALLSGAGFEVLEQRIGEIE